MGSLGPFAAWHICVSLTVLGMKLALPVIMPGVIFRAHAFQVAPSSTLRQIGNFLLEPAIFSKVDVFAGRQDLPLKPRSTLARQVRIDRRCIWRRKLYEFTALDLVGFSFWSKFKGTLLRYSNRRHSLNSSQNYNMPYAE